MRFLTFLFVICFLSSCGERNFGRHTEEDDFFSNFQKSASNFTRCDHYIVEEKVLTPVAGCPTPGKPEAIFKFDSEVAFNRNISFLLLNPSPQHRNEIESGEYIEDTFSAKTRSLDCKTKNKNENSYVCTLVKQGDDFGGFFRFKNIVVKNASCGSRSMYSSALPAGCNSFTVHKTKIGSQEVPELLFP